MELHLTNPVAISLIIVFALFLAHKYAPPLLGLFSQIAAQWFGPGVRMSTHDPAISADKPPLPIASGAYSEPRRVPDDR